MLRRALRKLGLEMELERYVNRLNGAQINDDGD
jgi:hypothetical protein